MLLPSSAFWPIDNCLFIAISLLLSTAMEKYLNAQYPWEWKRRQYGRGTLTEHFSGKHFVTGSSAQGRWFMDWKTRISNGCRSPGDNFRPNPRNVLFCAFFANHSHSHCPPNYYHAESLLFILCRGVRGWQRTVTGLSLIWFLPSNAVLISSMKQSLDQDHFIAIQIILVNQIVAFLFDILPFLPLLRSLWFIAK